MTGQTERHLDTRPRRGACGPGGGSGDKVRQVKMPDVVSVELNGSILARTAFGSTGLKDGDPVEFLYSMGGGAMSTRGQP